MSDNPFDRLQVLANSTDNNELDACSIDMWLTNPWFVSSELHELLEYAKSHCIYSQDAGQLSKVKELIAPAREVYNRRDDPEEDDDDTSTDIKEKVATILFNLGVNPFGDNEQDSEEQQEETSHYGDDEFLHDDNQNINSGTHCDVQTFNHTSLILPNLVEETPACVWTPGLVHNPLDTLHRYTSEKVNPLGHRLSRCNCERTDELIVAD